MATLDLQPDDWQRVVHAPGAPNPALKALFPGISGEFFRRWNNRSDDRFGCPISPWRSAAMIEMFAAVLVLSTVSGGLIFVFWLEARYGLHGPAEQGLFAPVRGTDVGGPDVAP
ncbi:MAG: hypothetical protein EOQ50_19375 [Mesorhizobium sp.]|uniref:hypothetical protein n=1 Tax=Mesorhizobium sp. TaxID=1871066 RepID=UPI000FE741F4|nr:hypothetical protein [Mesorhizobium sp.]RWB72399.1 MAG: hypothetical protein EOQ50_19375 [Mesorhizobium sp.]